MSIVGKIKGKIWQYLNEWASNTQWFNSTMQFEGCKTISAVSTFDNVIANLGSSSGYYAFNYQAAGVQGLNLAIPRQSLLADREMLKNYYSYLREGAVVLIPLCLFSSLEGENCDFPDIYYILFQSESIPNYSWKKKLRILSIYNNPIKYIPFYYLVCQLKNCLRRPTKTILDDDQMEKDADRWIRGWKEEFCITSFARGLSLVNKDSFESASKLLKEIVEFCLSRKLKPVMVLPPISRALSAKVDERMRQILIDDFVNQVESSNAPFINYIDDVDFYDDKLYRNAYFLNEIGAALFTKRVISDLRKLGCFQ